MYRSVSRTEPAHISTTQSTVMVSEEVSFQSDFELIEGDPMPNSCRKFAP